MSCGARVTRGRQSEFGEPGALVAQRVRSPVVVGGRGRPGGFETGAYVRSTLFSDVGPGFAIAQEEIFGTVFVVIPYADDEHALAIAHGTVHGLSAAVAGDEEHTMAIARPLRVGQLDVHGACCRGRGCSFAAAGAVSLESSPSSVGMGAVRPRQGDGLRSSLGLVRRAHRLSPM